MVYGCAFWPINEGKKMREKYLFNGKAFHQVLSSFLDSKQVKEEDRERMFEIMNKNEFTELGFFTSVLHAEYLSNTMKAENGRGGKNLNKISHDTAIDLINKVKSCGVNLKRVILDTVGQPESYKRLLRERLNDPNLEIIVESKADSTYPVVSAASIAAKVTRD